MKNKGSAPQRAAIVAAALAVAFVVSSCASAGPDASGGGTELTMWVIGDCPAETCMEAGLVKAFEKQNPDITIEIVSQPTDGYYAGLQSASVTGSGPDLAGMWPGGYMKPFTSYMANARDFVDEDLISESSGTDFFSEGLDNSNAVYAVPLNNQWYMGFYSKKAFETAGVTTVPTTWAELRDASEKLKAAGLTPIVNGSQDGSAQFQPLYEWGYLAAALPIEDWTKLYAGDKPYSNPVLQKQLEQWSGLYADGYLNEAAFNDPEVLTQFEGGEAGMMLSGGSWLIPQLEKSMGDDLGVLPPPYVDSATPVLVQTAGLGYAVMNYSKHMKEAGSFQAFILSDEGQQIIADLGQPTTRPGFTTTSAGINALTELSQDPGTKVYPMFDNFTQPPVTDAIYKNVGQALVGQVSPEDALAEIDAAFDALPDDQKKNVVPLSSK